MSYIHRRNCEEYEQDSRLEQYTRLMNKAFDDLMAAYKANGNTPGWTHLGDINGIQMYRKEPDEISPTIMYKGSLRMNIPFSYLLNYCLELNYKHDYDSLFEKGEDIEVFKDGLTKVTHLQYYGAGPVMARDFCSLSATRHLKENLYGVFGKAVEHPDCPVNHKKFIRGELILGGFIFKILNEDATDIELHYVSRADLKGSIPQRIIDAVGKYQPMFVETIRQNVEKRYAENNPPPNAGDHYLHKLSKVASIYEK